MFAAFGFGGGGSTFSATYRVYPVSFLEKESAERGDKLILPPSALDRLASLHIEYPMLFRAENRAAARSTHCGVLEFVADEGACYMPWWMMQNLALGEGDLVSVSSASLPKGTFVKLRPHTSDFLDISNPRAVLETTLRGYSCLTVGDAICLHYNAKRYYIDVIEAKPASAVSVIETDCEVDFAPPLDYVEPVYAPRGAGGEGGAAAGTAGAAHGGVGGEEAAADSRAAAGGAPSTSGAAAAAAAGAAPASASASAEAEEKQEPAFVPFVGSGRRLDGKTATATAPSPPSSSSAPPSSAPVAVPARPSAGAGNANASGSSVGGGGSSASGSARAQGTVVFGGGNRLLAKQQQQQQEKKPGGAAAAASKPVAQPPAAEEKKDSSAPSFEAFKGKGRSLRD